MNNYVYPFGETMVKVKQKYRSHYLLSWWCL